VRVTGGVDTWLEYGRQEMRTLFFVGGRGVRIPTYNNNNNNNIH